ncbi:MAG: hypothetical protein AB1629_08360, partial [Candidatus Omnitrophota bacterium]
KELVESTIHETKKSREQIADDLEVGIDTLKRWLSGKIKEPKIKQIFPIANYFSKQLKIPKERIIAKLIGGDDTKDMEDKTVKLERKIDELSNQMNMLFLSNSRQLLPEEVKVINFYRRLREEKNTQNISAFFSFLASSLN